MICHILNIPIIILNAGRGIFAIRTIEPGSFLVEYSGELITALEGDKREENSESVFRYFFQHKGKKWW